MENVTQGRSPHDIGDFDSMPFNAHHHAEIRRTQQAEYVERFGGVHPLEQSRDVRPLFFKHSEAVPDGILIFSSQLTDRGAGFPRDNNPPCNPFVWCRCFQVLHITTPFSHKDTLSLNGMTRLHCVSPAINLWC